MKQNIFRTVAAAFLILFSLLFLRLMAEDGSGSACTGQELGAFVWKTGPNGPYQDCTGIGDECIVGYDYSYL